MPEADDWKSGDHVTLRDKLSGGSIICSRKDVPYNPRMREYLKLCRGITCTPAKSTKPHCDSDCGCCIISTTSIVNIPVTFAGEERCSCICHEKILYVSNRKICFGTSCQSLSLALVCVSICCLLFTLRQFFRQGYHQR